MESDHKNSLIRKMLFWLFSLHPRDKKFDNETDKLRLSMRATAKARYNASLRLKHQGRFAFYTTTILSLGLIFIPLIQNSGLPLSIESGVLNAMQTFLAVAVLIYSVIIGTARHELRSEQLNECADKLKDLIRELSREKEAAGGKLSKEQLERFHERYSDITTDVDNHTRNDYRFTQLEMKLDYKITGIPRLIEWTQARFLNVFSFVFPLTLIAIEGIFITEILGITSIVSTMLSHKTV